MIKPCPPNLGDSPNNFFPKGLALLIVSATLVITSISFFKLFKFLLELNNICFDVSGILTQFVKKVSVLKKLVLANLPDTSPVLSINSGVTVFPSLSIMLETTMSYC